ncbi:MAG: hypothetical protein ABIJ39_14395 [Chloroflexota bacterium]
MNEHRDLTLEHILYALALLIGMVLRFINLGDLPLSDFEATGAYQAWQIVQGQQPDLGANPAYVHLTAVIFFVTGATNTLARFIPTLAGSMLVLLPWGLRDRIGRAAAILLAFGLALDPGLVAVSRLAGGGMLAVTFTLLAIAMWMKKRDALAGFFAGMAVLSGPAVWSGLVIVAAYRGLVRLLSTRKSGQEQQSQSPVGPVPAPEGLPADRLTRAIAWGLGSLFLVGSLFVLSPKGLSAFAGTIVEYVIGWWLPSGVPVWQVLLALPAYELFPLIFGIAAMIRGLRKKDWLTSQLSLVTLVALVLVLAYPGRQTGDLVWGIIPLWVLTVRELGQHFDFAGRSPWEVGGVMVVTVVILVFAWLNLASLINLTITSETGQVRLFMIIGILLLWVLSLLLIASGWSAAIARLGVVWGGVLFLSFFTVSMATFAAGLHYPRTVELWSRGSVITDADLVLQTAEELSLWNTGHKTQLPVTILNLDAPSLRWLFRDWQVEEKAALAVTDTPALIIAAFDSAINLQVPYRGQDFVWQRAPAWQGRTPEERLRWLIYHRLPAEDELILFWARADLMLDSQGLPAPPR